MRLFLFVKMITTAVKPTFNQVRGGFILIMATLIVCTLFSYRNEFVAVVLRNYGMVQLLHTSHCDPTWFLCANNPSESFFPFQDWDGNHKQLKKIEKIFREALVAYPVDSITNLHLAETLFSLGRIDEASRLLVEGGWIKPLSVKSLSSDERSNRSTLLMTGRYENEMVLGYMYISRKSWKYAANHFERSLAYGGEKVSKSDQQMFFTVSARALLSKNPALAGEFFFQATDYKRAVEVLRPLVDPAANYAVLNPEEKAWIAFDLGRAYKALDNSLGALEAFEWGWNADSDVIENGMAILEFDPDRQDILKVLQAAHPAYPSGRSTSNWVDIEETYIPSNQRFIGFDANPILLTASPVVELWLWWSASSGSGLNSQNGVYDLGDLLIQHQIVNNLVVNSDFEWGVKPNGLPIGWDHRIYSNSPESLYIAQPRNSSKHGNVLVANNQTRDSSGVISDAIVVDNNSWYLLASQIKSINTPNHNIGYICSGEGLQMPGPIFALFQQRSAKEIWINVVALRSIYHDLQAEKCQLILINYNNPGGLVYFDNLFFARIQLP